MARRRSPRDHTGTGRTAGAARPASAATARCLRPYRLRCNPRALMESGV